MLETMRVRLLLPKWDARRSLEKAQIAIAWRLPRWLVKWSTYRAIAHATSGTWGTTNPHDLDAMDLAARWEIQRTEPIKSPSNKTGSTER